LAPTIERVIHLHNWLNEALTAPVPLGGREPAPDLIRGRGAKGGR